MALVEALKGWRVVELSRSIAGRYCGRLFAACGADVQFGPDRDSETPFGQWLDQYKRRAGPDALRAADLIIAGPYADDIEAARLAIEKTGSKAALLALTWFDLDGPYAKLTMNDALMQAMTGVAFGFGEAVGPPILPQGHAPQLVGGLMGYIASVAGLMKRTRPKRIDVNVFEAALCFAEPTACGAAVSGVGSRRIGVNRFSPTYPCQFYCASDDWIGLTALTPAQWRSLCDLVGRPELGREPRFGSTLQRLRAADEIDALLAPVFAERSAEYWITEGVERRIPITPAPRPGAAPHMPHWRDRGGFGPIAEGSPVRGPRLPFKMSFDGVARSNTGGDLPLDGVRVVDFSMGWAGPLAARMFADLGADVVKVEGEERHDWWRSWEGLPSADRAPLERARNFLDVNRGKRGVLLDLTAQDDLAAAQALIARADVVIENLGPGVMAKLGLGVADQRKLRPGVISVTMGAFGAVGPLAGIRAYGSTVEQACGMPFVNGHEDWAPCLQHVAYGDPVAGLYATAAVLTALAGRERLGGAAIDLAQVECLFQLGADAIVNEQALGVRVREGSRRAGCAPCCVVRTADEEKWIAIAIERDVDWRALCQVIGKQAWAREARFASCERRAAHGDEIEAALADWAGARGADEAISALHAGCVPAARLFQGIDLVSDPALAAAAFWIEMERDYVGAHITGATPFRFDGLRPVRMMPAPTMGQHTDEVLAELRALTA